MDNYAVLQASSTPANSAVIIQPSLSLGLAGALLIAQLSVGQNPAPAPSMSNPRHSQVRILQNSPTFGRYTNLFTGEYEHSKFNFEGSIASFYAQLLSKQQPLGKEFEQVLHDNLWDLLVST
jgi:hypothetical protein